MSSLHADRSEVKFALKIKQRENITLPRYKHESGRKRGKRRINGGRTGGGEVFFLLLKNRVNDSSGRELWPLMVLLPVAARPERVGVPQRVVEYLASFQLLS